MLMQEKHSAPRSSLSTVFLSQVLEVEVSVLPNLAATLFQTNSTLCKTKPLPYQRGDTNRPDSRLRGYKIQV